MNYIWLTWFLLSMVALAAIEIYAYISKRPTLSGTIRTVSKQWPLTQGVLCLIAGILISHFWWPWHVCP
jgi:hypothetical protein